MHKNRYNSKVLINNFSEDQYDEGFNPRRPRLQSDLSTNFQTTYCTMTHHASCPIKAEEKTREYLASQRQDLLDTNPFPLPVKNVIPTPKAFPGHQPSRDCCPWSGYETTQGFDFVDPKKKRFLERRNAESMNAEELAKYREEWTKTRCSEEKKTCYRESFH